jgi:hypothetical protein
MNEDLKHPPAAALSSPFLVVGMANLQPLLNN